MQGGTEVATAAQQKSHQSCRFYVEISGVTQAVFTEVSGLSLEVATEDVEEGGHNAFVHRMPGRCKVGNLVLKRGMTKSNDLLKWHMQFASGKVERRHVSVIVYNPDGSESMRWNFTNAFPVKWTGPQFKADDTGTAIESMELAHEGFELG
jgi:phage tail-like protein